MSDEKDRRYQCSSEFGLYRYDSEEDYYAMKKKSARFGFQYLVVLFTSVIVLSAICFVTYNYASESSKIQISTIQPILNSSQFIQASIDNTENNTDITAPTSLSSDYPEPIALELRSNRRKSDDPRPFIYEIRDPKPIGFQSNRKQSYREQSSTPHRHRAKNIQEIIKLLEQDNQVSTSNNNNNNKFRNSKRKGSTLIQDPFFPYKPQNPSDINLLATNSFRFAPSVQVEVKKSPVIPEQYPKYEKLNYNQQDFDVQRYKKQKNIINYYNQRFQPNRVQPFRNRPYNEANLNQINKKFLPNVQPMIVHLNLYPKKKKKQLDKDQRLSETNIHQNCTDEEVFQIKNASEFNNLIEKVRHTYLNTNGKVTDNLYRVKNTLLQLNQPEHDKVNDFKYLPNNNNIEVQKSIGFTIINPNFSSIEQRDQRGFESQRRPVNNENKQFDYNNENYDLEVGEANDYGEPITLPLPTDIFQRYFNTKPTPKYSNIVWDDKMVQENPNLVNHRPVFQDGRDE